MDSSERRKRQYLEDSSSEALQRIADHYPEGEKPTATEPLAGIAHIQGIGQVPVGWIRSELSRRENQNA